MDGAERLLRVAERRLGRSRWIEPYAVQPDGFARVITHDADESRIAGARLEVREVGTEEEIFDS